MQAQYIGFKICMIASGPDSMQVRWLRGMPLLVAIRPLVLARRACMPSINHGSSCHVAQETLLDPFGRIVFARFSMGGLVFRILQVVVLRFIPTLAADPTVRSCNLRHSAYLLMLLHRALRVLVLMMTIIPYPYWRIFSTYIIIFVYLIVELLMQPWRLRSVQIFSLVSHFLLLFTIGILFRPASNELVILLHALYFVLPCID